MKQKDVHQKGAASFNESPHSQTAGVPEVVAVKMAARQQSASKGTEGKKLVLKRKSWQALFKYLNIIGLFVCFWIFYKGFKSGFFTDEQQIRQFLEQAGMLAPLVFMLIQFVQVVIPVIPGALTIPMGTMVFGVASGFLLNFLGIMLGSIVNFWLARRYGRPFVRTMVDDRQYSKYVKWLDSPCGFERLFTYTIFLPIAPADFLCYFAGLSAMNFKKYLLILTLSKIPTLFIYQYGTTELLKLIMGH